LGIPVNYIGSRSRSQQEIKGHMTVSYVCNVTFMDVRSVHSV